jgi:taurine dioxygenase
MLRAEFVYKHRWEEQMLVMWDNRSVMHCAQGGYAGHRRVMHRTTVAGTVPV